jgi:hypothetical protein
MTTPGFTRRQVWQYLEPVILKAVNDLRSDPYLNSPAMQGSVLRKIVRLNPWHKNIPYRLVHRASNSITDRIGKNERDLPAGREELLQKNGESVRCVVSGHTHQPQVALLDAQDGVERYYFNSGTWRNQVPVSPNQASFGRIKTFSNVVIYRSDENHSHAETAPPGHLISRQASARNFIMACAECKKQRLFCEKDYPWKIFHSVRGRSQV